MSQKEAIAKSPSGRVKRTPIGVRNRLTVSNKDPNFEYRIVNDKDDRIERFKEGGWELVSKEEGTIGDKRLDVASSEGSYAAIAVGKGDKACLMRIKKEWYAEDQQAKMDQIAATEQSMIAEALNGTYGEYKTTR